MNLSLAGLFAAVTSGEDRARDLNPPAARLWLLRLWHEAGVAPVAVNVPELQNGPTHTARAVAYGFALLGALRAADDIAAGPMPFAPSFAAAWCRVSEDEARRGLIELRRAGWLRPTRPSRPGVGYLYDATPRGRV